MGGLRSNFLDHTRVPVTGDFLNAATSSLKRVTGGTFKIRKCFQRSSKNLAFHFLSNKDKTKFKNHQRIFTS